jgi:threonine dehydrogenase-like Zn-dependent dehydrogenase
MKAIRIHKFGSTLEVLQYEEVPIPEPGANELLIKVEAASLNRADLGLRKGYLSHRSRGAAGHPWPRVCRNCRQAWRRSSRIQGWPASSGIHRHGRLRRIRAR